MAEPNKKEAPKVKRFFLLFFLDLLKDFVSTIKINQKKYGDIFQKKFLGQNYFFICHPKMANYILSENQNNYLKHHRLRENLSIMTGGDNLLTTNNMEVWTHDRKLADTAFDASVFFDRYTTKITQCCETMLNQWEVNLEKGNRFVALGDEIGKLTAENMRVSVFDEINLDVDGMVKHIPAMFKIFLKRSLSIFKFLWMLPTKRKKLFDAEMEFFENEMNKAFRSRLEQNQDKDDLLSAFMHDYQIKDMQCPHLKHVGAQMKSLNIVGFTTTTSAFGWVFAMLLSHPEWQKKIADEIKAVCKDKNPTYEDYKNLRYTQAFVSEVLRLYPSLRMIPREVKEDDCVEGYHIPAGSAVLVSLYHMQRHKDYWERPEEFDPNRFINKPFGQDDPIAYKPFGIGKRICLGKDFALLELGLVTAMLLRKFHLVTPDPFEIKVQYLAYVFMYPQLGNVEIVKADS